MAQITKQAHCSGADHVGEDDGLCASHATFSCEADASWLWITYLICLIWAAANLMIHIRRIRSTKHVVKQVYFCCIVAIGWDVNSASEKFDLDVCHDPKLLQIPLETVVEMSDFGASDVAK